METLNLIALTSFRPSDDLHIVEVGEKFVSKPALGRLLVAIGRARLDDDAAPKAKAKAAPKKKRT